jgi:two-component system response regulator DevR
MTPVPIRLILADDHEMVRVGLRTVLTRNPRIEIVAEAGSVLEAIAATTRLKPDIILLDVRFPDGNGFDACRQIQIQSPQTRVLILTSYGDDETVLGAIEAGADGYLLKEIDADGLVRAIEDVIAGRSILDPLVTRRVFSRIRNKNGIQKDKLDLLSAQERRVLALVSEGKTNKEIAAEMGLSDKTVKNYLSNLLEKLHFSRRSQAAAFFAQHSGK